MERPQATTKHHRYKNKERVTTAHSIDQNKVCVNDEIIF